MDRTWRNGSDREVAIDGLGEDYAPLNLRSARPASSLLARPLCIPRPQQKIMPRCSTGYKRVGMKSCLGGWTVATKPRGEKKRSNNDEQLLWTQMELFFFFLLRLVHATAPSEGSSVGRPVKPGKNPRSDGKKDAFFLTLSSLPKVIQTQRMLADADDNVVSFFSVAAMVLLRPFTRAGGNVATRMWSTRFSKRVFPARRGAALGHRLAKCLGNGKSRATHKPLLALRVLGASKLLAAANGAVQKGGERVGCPALTRDEVLGVGDDGFVCDMTEADLPPSLMDIDVELDFVRPYGTLHTPHMVSESAKASRHAYERLNAALKRLRLCLMGGKEREGTFKHCREDVMKRVVRMRILLRLDKAREMKAQLRVYWGRGSQAVEQQLMGEEIGRLTRSCQLGLGCCRKRGA